MTAPERRHLRPERLARVARQPLAPREQLHVDDCADCRRALGRILTAQTTLRTLADREPPEPTPAELARAEASVRWTRVAPAPVVRRPFVIAIGLVATVAATCLAWLVRPGPHVLPAPAHLAERVAPSPPAILTALVTLVGGEVRVGREPGGAHVRPLDLAAHLGAGDCLGTGGNARAAAQWSEGSGFLLYADTQLALARLEARTQRLELSRGKVAVRVGPHEPGESLQVITPDHVVSVHGTWFTVASAQHVTTVEVLEGTVEVSERDGSAATMLTAPARAVFGRGHTTTATLAAREVGRLRAGAEMNLLPWAGLEATRDASGELLIASEPSIAELDVDGVSLGATPLAVRRPLGRHYLELSRVGFAPLHQWVTVGREPGALRLALVHAPPAPPSEVPVEIESMVRRRATQIRACYERRLKRDPALAGTVSLRLRVGDAGQVTHVGVEQSTLSDPLVAECLRREAAGWNFSVGRNATVVYPFVFRTQ